MKRKWLSILGISIITAMSITGCSTQNSSQKSQTTAGDSATQDENISTDVTTQETRIAYDENDADSSYDTVTATITCQGSTVSVEGDNVDADGSKITIKKAGTYVLEGNMQDGSVEIAADEDAVVHLVLKNATLHSKQTAAVYVSKAKKCILTLAEGTTNEISNGAYTIEDDTDVLNAALYSKSDLTINGTGALTVSGEAYNGITCKDNLKIMEGALTVTAENNGIVGKDSVSIKDGTLAITCKNDGIKSNNEKNTAKGYIAIDGGNITITADGDGISAETSLLIAGGNYTITSGGGSTGEFKKDNFGGEPKERPSGDFGGIKPDGTTVGDAKPEEFADKDKDMRGEPPEKPEQMEGTTNGDWKQPPQDRQTQDSTEETTETVSTKGLKAGTLLDISGGTFEINSLDDALHVNGNGYITGGDFTIATTDDGIHADETLLIEGGNIEITESYEGLEAYSMTITNGNITVTSEDDGINIAGRKDSTSSREMKGEDSSSGDALTINGGVIHVNAKGDGLDANGSIYINGGNTIVSGPTNGGNGTLDYDDECVITGGTLLTSGSNGMHQAPTEASSQNIISIALEKQGNAGDMITLKDSDGNVLVSYTADKIYETLIISSSDIEEGKTYTLIYGENQTTITTSTESTLTTVGNIQGDHSFGREELKKEKSKTGENQKNTGTQEDGAV